MTEEEDRIIHILDIALTSLVSQYEDFERYVDAEPTLRLYHETETLILKAIRKIDSKTSIDRNFWKMNELPNWIKWSKVKGRYIIIKRK